jgi:hypothetical protein
MSPMLELVLQASTQLWNPLIIEVSNTKLISLITCIEIHHNVGKMKKRKS